MGLRIRDVRKVGGRGIPLGAEMGDGMRDEPDRTFPHSLVFFFPLGRGHSSGPLVTHMELSDSTSVSLNCRYAASLTIRRSQPPSACTRPSRAETRKAGIYVLRSWETHRILPSAANYPESPQR